MTKIKRMEVLPFFTSILVSTTILFFGFINVQVCFQEFLFHLELSNYPVQVSPCKTSL